MGSSNHEHVENLLNAGVEEGKYLVEEYEALGNHKFGK